MSEKDDILIEEVRELPKADRDNTAVILNERRRLSEPLTPDEARRKMAAMTRRSFIIGGAAAAFGVLGWRWMSEETKHKLLRSTLELNERVARAFYRSSQLAPEFPGHPVTMRFNGDIGMTQEFDAANWKLSLGGIMGGDVQLALDEIKQLPRTDMIIEFKCIEGWSTITHFAGTRFSDFAARYAPENRHAFVSLVTPDEGYYVGWDTPAIMHPQTLLAYEMNGQPLRPEHGAPLRLASPTKYGIKQIKRIGRIEFTSERPRDYWAEQGYDWYSGL
jgi:hypothetical protein